MDAWVITTKFGERIWYADDAAHAIEQHLDAGLQEKIVKVEHAYAKEELT